MIASALPQTTAAPTARRRESFDQFRHRMQEECCTESAISLPLYRSAIRIISDIDCLPGGDVEYPIHESLNWKRSRFPNQAHANQYAALFQNEDQSTWQAKLAQFIWDAKKQKYRKYETPVGNGSRAFFPAIDVQTWHRIAVAHNLQDYLPTWVKQALANKQWALASSTAKLLTLDEFESYATRLKRTCATRLCKVISPPTEYSLHTAENISQNCQQPLSFTDKKTQKIRFNISDSIQTTANIPSKLRRVPNGSSKINPGFQILPSSKFIPFPIPFAIETTSFWQWIELLPIPIVITEGGKKALCLLSHGYVAISLYGINGGYRSRDEAGDKILPYLIPDISRFAAAGRTIALAFDQDESSRTRKRVNIAIARFGALLKATTARVTVCSWDQMLGKGVDDLIVNNGRELWNTIYASALEFSDWQGFQRLDQRLSWNVSLQLKLGDISKLRLDQTPNAGIIAIQSPKGTGKTKLIRELIGTSEKALAAGHRVALMRNICSRLRLDYRGDLDRVRGRLINGATYSLRVGFCVDSLLAIDPEAFQGCDLIIDEAVQVFRHLLTSATCAQDGKRPALLARLSAIVQTARRVIVADADLDNASLHYVRSLKGEDCPVFLIKNDYQLQGYQVRFLEADDRSAIVNEILSHAKTVPTGKALFIATDSLCCAQAIAQLLAQQFPSLRVLTINSKTSSGECERKFIETPDSILEAGEYDVILCTPSMATGVSIESIGIVHKVFGVFTGASSNDADMAQSLARVREPVDRVVWCAKQGTNFCEISRTTSPIELKSALRDQTSAIVQIVRSNLRADTIDQFESYDWQSDPHLNLYCRIAAEHNRSMWQLRESLRIRLKYEGHTVIVETHKEDRELKTFLVGARQAVKQSEAQAVAKAKVLNYAEVAALELKEDLSYDDRVAISKYYLADFYGIDPKSLTIEDILNDREGRQRGEILNLEAQLYGNLALDRSAKSLEKQAAWNQGLCPWDISRSEARRWVREKIGINQILERLINGEALTPDDYAHYANQARIYIPQIKLVLHLNIENLGDTQIINQLLAQLGVKTKRGWSRSLPGHEGEKLKIYRLDQNQWQATREILERRKERRDRAQSGSPDAIDNQNLMGDPGLELTEDGQVIPPKTIEQSYKIFEPSSSDALHNELSKLPAIHHQV